jgi:hypothetical protein
MAEDNGRVALIGLIGEQQVDARLELGGDPGEGEAPARARRRP